jgi:uncharacterized protein
MTAIKIIGATVLFGLSVLSVISVAADTANNCHIGSYRLSDGRVVDIAPSDGDTLRWRMLTGETGQLHPQKDGTWSSTFGWTNRADGKNVAFSGCAKDEITFGNVMGKRIAFDVSNTAFDSNGVKLLGRLVMPKDVGKVPVVVLVHGSERDSALDTYALQRIFPAQCSAEKARKQCVSFVLRKKLNKRCYMNRVFLTQVATDH